MSRKTFNNIEVEVWDPLNESYVPVVASGEIKYSEDHRYGEDAEGKHGRYRLDIDYIDIGEIKVNGEKVDFCKIPDRMGLDIIGEIEDKVQL